MPNYQVSRIEEINETVTMQDFATDLDAIAAAKLLPDSAWTTVKEDSLVYSVKQLPAESAGPSD